MTPPYPPIVPIYNAVKIACQTCGAPMGETVTIDGVMLFRVAMITARAIHGSCSLCGSEFHWTMSDAALSKLIQRAQNIGKDGTIPARQSST